MISIWFIIGIAMLVNGVLILGAGIYDLSHPVHDIVLSNLHANAWWGALMTLIGLLYCYFFSPKRTKAK